MATYIHQPNLSIAWLEAMEHLINNKGEESNLIVALGPGKNEDPKIRELLDGFLLEHESLEVREVQKVADTIFPIDLYNPNSPDPLNDFLDRQDYAWIAEEDYLRRGKYIQRLTNWEKRDKKQRKRKGYVEPERINQLRRVIQKLIRHRTNERRQRHNGNAYEMAVSAVETCDLIQDGAYDLRIYDPERDNIEMGFPCLSHISLTLYHDRIDMTALYRNQFFITKAYGNFVGLFDLLTFICQESGFAVGQLVCVATHADGELKGKWSKSVKSLVTDARETVGLLD